MALKLLSEKGLSKHRKREAIWAPPRGRNSVTSKTSGYGTLNIKADMSEEVKKRERKLMCFSGWNDRGQI